MSDDEINKEYPERSGCGAVLGVIAFIVVFWAVVGAVFLFT